MEKIICSCGCICDASQNFCAECGSRLSNVVTNDTGSIPSIPDKKSEPVNVFPDDTDLKLLLDCFEKVGPLVTGDRYSETVLYYDEKNDSYQIHKYASQGYGNNTHEAYYTTKEHADRIMKSINTDVILNEENRGMPVCGGSRVIKFINAQDELVRVEYHTGEIFKAVADVLVVVHEAVKNENRIVPEYAKNWKQFNVVSTGMSMDMCHSYFLKRDEQGSTWLKGNCFIDGVRYELSEYCKLTEEEKIELASIPLGLMISKNFVAPNPYAINDAFLMANDESKCSCTITYGDGKADTKIPDADMISALDKLLKKVFARNKSN